MTPQLQKRLGRTEIDRYSSAYIDSGVKQEAWEIEELDVTGEVLRARVRMASVFVSPTDTAGYHLSIFSTQEFLAQLANIYLHLVAGAESKERETWMRESSITTRTPIRDRDRILVEMTFTNVRNVSGGVYAQASARVFDEQGGLFTARLKGMLS